MTSGRAAGILAFVFAVIATIYSLVVPVLEAPDEPPHFLYVSHLIQGRGLPVLTPDGKNNVAGQEGVQPPLYYLLGATAAFWTDPRDFAEWQLTNWHQNVDRTRPGNKNLIVHTDRERFPFTGSILSIHVVRLVSVALGTATVVLTYLIGRAAGLRGRLALLAAAFVAFNPQFVFISSVINNDSVGITLSALALLLSLRLVLTVNLQQSAFNPETVRPSYQSLIVLGVIAGLAALGKLSGLIILPLVVAAWWVSRSHWLRMSGRDLREVLFILVPFTIVAGWWYVRNQLIYGDPVGWDRMMADIDSIVRRVFRWEDIIAELVALKESSWAVFGWRNIAVDGWIYRALDVGLILAIIGLVVAWRTRAIGDRPNGRACLIFGFWITAFAISLSRWISLVEHTGQGRLLFPVLPAIAVLVVTGLASLWPPPARATAGQVALWPASLPTALVLTLAALTIVAPWRYILPAYPPVRYLSESDADALGTPIRARFGSVAELISYRFEPEVVAPGDDAWLVLAWRAQETTTADLHVNLRLLAHDFRPVLEEAAYPALGAHPFVRWRPGEIIEDRRLIRLPATLVGPDYLRVELSVRPREQPDDRLLIRDTRGESAGDRIALGPLRVAPLGTWPPPSAVRFPPVNLSGHQILAAQTERSVPGEPAALAIFLYWIAGETGASQPVTLRLVGSAGTIVNNTAVPGEGWFPMANWRAGDRVEDERDVTLPTGLAPGEYRLIIESVGNAPVEIMRVSLP